MNQEKRISSSFRDPNGFVYVHQGLIHRQVNPSYKVHYDKLMDSGLYDTLTEHNLLIQHEEIEPAPEHAYKILQPQQLPFISYPYEWCFSQLKDAALATLRIQKAALSRGMTLKDASAYNIQFIDNKPIFIDTLSFEAYEEGTAWIAYKQFCQHFLAPLVLMSYKDVRLSQLLRVFIDGIPLDLASSLLPKRSYLNIGVLMHLHLHARTQKRYEDDTQATQKQSLSKKALLNIISDLRNLIKSLKWDHKQTAWSEYYEGDSYQSKGFNHKQELVDTYIKKTQAEIVWDLGANTGVFSRISSHQGIFTISMDYDPGVVEANYLHAKQNKENSLLPLLIDLSNPSSSIGWANLERPSLTHRKHADCLLALALVHHLAIGNNVPLYDIACYFASLSEWLIIEFVPKSDAKVKTLLATREDVFPQYTQQGFEEAFGKVFSIIESTQIEESDRTLYLLQKKPTQ